MTGQVSARSAPPGANRFPTGARLAELMASLSLATDLANALPLEHTLRTCLVALGLGRTLGLRGQPLADVYYTALMRFVGCTSFAHEDAAHAGGDDNGMRGIYAGIEQGKPQQFLRQTFLHLAEHQPPLTRARAVATMVLKGREFFSEVVAAHCEVGDRLAQRLGMAESIRRALAQMFARWDGKGVPPDARGDRLELATRIVHVAHYAVFCYQQGGSAAAVEVARQRSGGSFDPAVAEAFVAHAPALLRAIEPSSVWDVALEAEPEPWRQISRSRLDEVALALADFADLKSPYTLGHSRGVAELAGAAAHALGLADEEATTLRRAGLLHDLGRVSVPNGIWEKPGRLTAAEWERVRLHPYYGERMLTGAPLLEPLARLAGGHHERLDGSGYHRGAPAAILTPAMRLLAAADAYQAMIEPRPHRPPLAPEAAAAQLTAEVRAQRLDGECTRAVLEAAGHQRVKSPRAWPAGLSDREVEVLRLVALGKANKEIARALVISAATVHDHVLHIYQKIGASTRAGAALFAMEQGLVPSQMP